MIIDTYDWSHEGTHWQLKWLSKNELSFLFLWSLKKKEILDFDFFQTTKINEIHRKESS